MQKARMNNAGIWWLCLQEIPRETFFFDMNSISPMSSLGDSESALKRVMWGALFNSITRHRSSICDREQMSSQLITIELGCPSFRTMLCSISLWHS